MTELETKLQKVTEIQEQCMKDKLQLEMSAGKYDEAMNDLMTFLGYKEGVQFQPLDLIKKGYEKGKES